MVEKLHGGFFHKPRLTVGDAVTGLGPLIARGMMES